MVESVPIPKMNRIENPQRNGERGKEAELTCVNSDSGVAARSMSDGARYWRTRERAKGEDGKEHAYAAPDVRRVAHWDQRRCDEARERAGCCTIEDG